MLGAAAVVLAVAAGLAFAVPGSAVAETVADRCFKHHKFGQESVPVAKTADGTKVLGQVQWGWHDSIGCYLVLDDQAINTLRTNAADITSPSPTSDETSTRCFEHHKFGQESVPVAKTADGTKVLAQVQWGWHDSIGCYLVLDNRAVNLLRTKAPAPPPTFTAITAGEFHTCGLLSDQTIECWGNNDFGQLDAPNGQYTSVTSGDGHACGLRVDQTIRCWGVNSFGEIEVPTGVYTDVSAGRSHTCGLRTDKSITCWGSNGTRQGEVIAGEYISVSSGSWHTCGLKSDQTIACWGNSRTGTTTVPQRPIHRSDRRRLVLMRIAYQPDHRLLGPQ